jgi:hypothetical protein
MGWAIAQGSLVELLWEGVDHTPPLIILNAAGVDMGTSPIGLATKRMESHTLRTSRRGPLEALGGRSRSCRCTPLRGQRGSMGRESSLRRWHNNAIMSVGSSWGGTVRTSIYLPQGRRDHRHTYPRVRWVVSAFELRR